MSDKSIAAFPGAIGHEHREGMTLRDWFAGKAMQGFAADSYADNPELVAKTAYEWADAMLRERMK